MAKAKKEFVPKSKAASGVENVEEVLTRSEQFIEQNQKLLTGIAIAIIVLILGIFSLNRFYLKPREASAQGDMFAAQNYFAKDSFKIALQGDGVSYLGFLDIIDEYPFTRSANLAHYYAGACYMKLGKFEEAIEMLKKFSLKSALITPIALGTLGDAYAETGKLNEAANYYKQAADKNDNDLTAPIYLMKAGKVYEQLGDFEKALSVYKTIQTDYSKTMQARLIEKYITRAEIQIKK